MVLATTFADRGDWTVEQQFVLQMGSSYLLAHGIGTPLAKAESFRCWWTAQPTIPFSEPKKSIGIGSAEAASP